MKEAESKILEPQTVYFIDVESKKFWTDKTVQYIETPHPIDDTKKIVKVTFEVPRKYSNQNDKRLFFTFNKEEWHEKITELAQTK